jgi:hypothetical protein
MENAPLKGAKNPLVYKILTDLCGFENDKSMEGHSQ